MKIALMLVVGVFVIFSTHIVDGGSIPQKVSSDNVRMLRSLIKPVDGLSNDDKFIGPSKRFASQYYTNMRSKYYDKAAKHSFLKSRLMGKRMFPTPANNDAYLNQDYLLDGIIDQINDDSSENDAFPATSGLLVFFSPLDDDAIRRILYEEDEETNILE